MTDRFFVRLVKWGCLILVVIMVAGRLGILMQSPGVMGRAQERAVLAEIVLLLAGAFVVLLVVLMVIETVRRVKREK